MGSIDVTWWNLENFFDTEDDPISQDLEFTAANGWTEEAFTAKRANLAQALKATHAGAGPDLLVVAEIEKDVLLEQLVAEMGSPLEVVHDPTGTSDLRGIDVAMAFHPDKLALLSQKSHVVHLRFRTRDLFEVVFKVKDTDEILVVVGSHWPSRRLGRFDSEPARITVAENIAFIVEDHVKVLPGDYEQLRAQNDLAQVQAKFETKVMVLGDFNDEPATAASSSTSKPRATSTACAARPTTLTGSKRPRTTARRTCFSSTPRRSSCRNRRPEPSLSTVCRRGRSRPTATSSSTS